MNALHRLLPPIAVALVLFGCTQESPNIEPPEFNAFDPTLQCGTGQVGWDFATGGAPGEEIRNPRLSSELKILSATYGGNCGLTVGNWTDKFERVCNGNLSCSRAVFVTGADTDPASSCLKDFSITYSCGDEAATYTRTLPVPVYNTTAPLSLSCGEKISIAGATYGKNCLQPPNVNATLTAKLIDKCSGSRRCAVGFGNDLFETDPNLQCFEDTEVSWLCGNDPTPIVKNYTFQNKIEFECPTHVRQPTAENTIHVISATYGKNLGAPVDNWKSTINATCGDKFLCPRSVVFTGDVEPYPGQNKDFQLKFTCGAETHEYEVNFPATETNKNKLIIFQCGEPLTMVSASYAKNANPANTDNFLATASATCDGLRTCLFAKTGNALFGSDPAVGQTKTWSFQYRCGTSPNVNSYDNISENSQLGFNCSVGDQGAVSATGIRITSAVIGSTPDAGTAANCNAFSKAQAACYAKDLCTYTPTSADRMGCIGNTLKVEYRCGEDPTVLTAQELGAGQGVSVSCAPKIHVLAASYGEGSCGAAPFATYSGGPFEHLRTFCDGKTSCTFYPLDKAVAPLVSGCANVWTARYQCGNDPSVLAVSMDRATSFGPVAVNCPTLSAPYSRKGCIPQFCYGNQRRDPNLGCVPDVTRRLVPGSTSWDARAYPVNLFYGYQQAHVFNENSAYNITFNAFGPYTTPKLADGGTDLATPIASMTAWVVDTFEPNTAGVYANTPKVEGLRCLMATMDPVGNLSPALKGTAIPPPCFQSSGAWRDAAKRKGISETDFRAGYHALTTRVRLSLDPEGKLARPTSQAMPNPIGFFYQPGKQWTDLIKYYKQTELPPTTAYDGLSTYPVTFEPSNTITVSATNPVVSRSASVTLSIFEGGPSPQVDLDFQWTFNGDSPGRNPFSPTGAPLTTLVKTTTQRKLRAVAEILPESMYNSDGQNWTNALPLGDPAMLVDGLPGGATTRLTLTMSQALRRQINKLGTAGGWRANTTEVSRLYKIRVCLNLDDVGPPVGLDQDQGKLTQIRGGITYSVLLGEETYPASFTRCAVVQTPFSIIHDKEQRFFFPSVLNDESQAADSKNNGNATLSTANDSSTETLCATPVPDKTDCQQSRRTELGSGGDLGRSLYSSTSSTKFVGNKGGFMVGTVKTKLELAGFSVINDTDVSQPSTMRFHRIQGPPWGPIATALNGGEAAEIAEFGTEASPFFKEWKNVNLAKVDGSGNLGGLGLAIGAHDIIPAGPIFIDVEVFLAVAFTIGFEMDVGATFDDTSYACRNSTTKCLVKFTAPLTLQAAFDDCAQKGGRLAEMQTQAEGTVVKAAITDTNRYWLGGTSSYEYQDETCGAAGVTLSTTCKTNSLTRYRWTDSNTLFAQQSGAVTTLSNVANFGGTLLTGDLITPIPAAAGVAVKVSSAALKAESVLASTALPYFCEIEPVVSAQTSDYSVGAIIGASAGLGASACVPSRKLGLCIAANVAFLQMTASYAYSKRSADLMTYATGGGIRVFATRGRKGNTLKFGIGFLAASIYLELRLPIPVVGTIPWEILHFNGFKVLDATVFDDRVAFRRNYP